MVRLDPVVIPELNARFQGLWSLYGVLLWGHWRVRLDPVPILMNLSLSSRAPLQALGPSPFVKLGPDAPLLLQDDSAALEAWTRTIERRVVIR